eukprot:PhM_4_TR16955/c0_g1_i1/m.83533
MKVFSSARLGSLTLRNRIVMAPMTRRATKGDGVVTEESVLYYARRAAADVGLIITEGVVVAEDGMDNVNTARLYDDDHVRAWTRVVEEVHKNNGHIAAQLWHTGPQGLKPMSAKDKPGNEDYFDKARDAYVNGARLAIAAGFDAIELHGAHGYLLDSFMDPTEYAAPTPVAERMKWPIEVVRAVRAAVPTDYPIIYRFSQWRVTDYELIKYRTPEELAVFVTALKEAGVDVLHPSTRRVMEPGFPDVDATKTLAQWTRELSGLPTIAVGSVSVSLPFVRMGDGGQTSDPTPALSLVESGSVDFLAVGRALISNPDWVPKVRDGRWEDLVAFDPKVLATLY